MDARDLVVCTSVAYAAVMAVAGAGKLWDRHLRDAAVGIAELVLAVLVVLQPMWPVLVLAAVVALGYAGHSFLQRRPAPCACFGTQLPQTGVAGQRWRNSLLFVDSVALLLASRPGGRPDVALVDTSLGLCVGACLVGGPWLATWLRAGYQVS